MMDLSFSRRTRVRKGSPRIHRREPHAGDEARAGADAVRVLRSGYWHRLAKIAAQKGLGRTGMAGRIWWTGLDSRAALDLRSRMRPRWSAERQRDGRQDGRPRHHRFWQFRAEGLVLAAHSLRRRLLVSGLLRT